MTEKALKVTVVKKSGDKTVKCEAVTLKKHPIYKKYIKSHSFYLVHDEKNTAKVGDEIFIRESKPISKKKNWIIVEGETK
jgi:small subunit ribosomal protein S17